MGAENVQPNDNLGGGGMVLGLNYKRLNSAKMSNVNYLSRSEYIYFGMYGCEYCTVENVFAAVNVS
jgi:hypothetical protein